MLMLIKGSGCGSVVERSPLTPEIRGSNPVIGNLSSNICLLSTVLKKRKKEKEAGNGPFLKKMQMTVFKPRNNQSANCATTVATFIFNFTYSNVSFPFASFSNLLS